MRIEKLNLEKFGLFDGLELDLSDSGVRLHVIHGPNEAGKSTALAAIIDLLFGVDERTPYAFRHSYTQLRIGATIASAAGQSLTFKRRKGRQHTLLASSDESPLADSALGPFLKGIDRALFERMFGLDHERLRLGGEAMLDAKGELARSLFEAGSGAVGVAQLAESIAQQADAIGGPTSRRASTKPFWQARAQYDDAVARMRNDGLKADVWNAATKAREDATARRTEIDRQLTQHRESRSTLERIRRVAPLLHRIAQLNIEHAPLASIQLLPETFDEAWRQAVQAEQTARSEAGALVVQLEGLQGELKLLGEPGPWLALADRIDSLNGGDYVSKRTDLPHRARDLESGRKELQGLILQLGATFDPNDIDTVRPSQPATARIRVLITEWNRLDEARRTATSEFEAATRAAEEAEAAADALGAPPDPAEARVALQAALTRGDTDDARSKAKRDLASAEAALATAMGTLASAELKPEDLAARAFPDLDAILGFERRFAELDRVGEAAKDAVRTIGAELRRVNAELEGLQAAGDVPTPAALAASREHRDHGWRLIRRRWLDGMDVPEDQVAAFTRDTSVSEAFEAAVAAADQVADRRQDEAQRIERFFQLTAQLAKATSDAEAAAVRITEIANDRSQADTEWSALWTPSSVALRKPAEMRAWLARKDTAQLKHAAVLAAREQLASVDAAEGLARGDLLRAAASLEFSAAADLSTPALRDKVKAAVDAADRKWVAYQTSQRAVVDRRRELTARQKKLDGVESQLSAWRERWASEIPALSLVATASTGEAQAALDVWNRIDQVDTDQTQLRRRRDQMQAAIDAFEAEIRQLIIDLGDAGPAYAAMEDLATVVRSMQQQVLAARELATRIDEKRRNMRKAEAAHDAAEGAARRTAAELASLREVHGITQDADVPQLIEDSSKLRALDAELRSARLALAEQGDGRSEEDLRALVATVDAESAKDEVTRLESEIQRLQTEAQDVAQAETLRKRDLEELQSREGIGAAAHEANAAAATMVAHLDQWLRFKAAGIILERAAERYRAANQNPLVKRASEIFQAIAGTGDNPIVRLAVDYGERDMPVLVGYRQDRSQCPVDGMSGGTADQLYLALRIAAIERFMESGEPMPFIADDLFITSDEDRTVPGIKALAELGARTQVLLFTHHRYVVEAAEASLAPGHLKVHSLRGVQIPELESARS